MQKALISKLFLSLLFLFTALSISAQGIPPLSLEQKKQLYNPGNNTVLGNPKGDVTIVEFFDYQCPYCHKIAPQLSALVEKDPNVRIIFKEFLLFGPTSELATRAVLAANMQGKYMSMHNALMSMRLPLSFESIMRAARDLNLDTQKLQRDMDSDAVTDQIETNTRLAHKLGIYAAPVFIFANSSVIGNPPNKNAKQIMSVGEVSAAKLESFVSRVRE